MQTFLLVMIGLLTPFCNSLAQIDSSRPEKNSPKIRRAKAIYIEALGSGGTDFSLNYDMRFKTGRKGWGFRTGITRPAQVGQTSILSFPILINNVQSDRRVSLEAGAGFLVNYKKLTYEDTDNIIQRRQSIELPAVANVGVRFQPLKTGLVWRLYWAPTWRISSSLNKPQLYWFGTSLGIGFN